MPRKKRSKEAVEPVAIGTALAELPIAEEITAEERHPEPEPDRPPEPLPPTNGKPKPYTSRVQTAFEESFDIGGERMHTRFFAQTRQFQIKFDGEQSRASKDHIEKLGFHYIAQDRIGGESQIWVNELHRWPTYQEREDFRRDCQELANQIRQDRGFEPSIGR